MYILLSPNVWEVKSSTSGEYFCEQLKKKYAGYQSYLEEVVHNLFEASNIGKTDFDMVVKEQDKARLGAKH